MENMNVYMPTRLVTGKGCVKEAGAALAALGKAALVLTGGSAARLSGALADVEEALDGAGIAHTLWDGVGQNPTFAQCAEAAKVARSCGAEFIIGIGGGSPLDAAKVVAILAVNEGLTEAELFALSWQTAPLPIVGVGTTAGTGSEVTKISVITSSAGRKTAVRDDSMYLTIAYGDPTYTLTLPDVFTRSTAVDALAHCVESYFSKTANEISKAYAVRGIRLLRRVFENAEPSAYGTLSYEERETLYHASIYGGLAINITGTAMAHALGYLLTERHGVPHGAACAVFLPAFYAHNKAAAPKLTEVFLEEIGLDEAAYLEMLAKVSPKYTFRISEEELASQQDRYCNNPSLNKVWGGVSLEEALEILRSGSA